MSTAIAGKKLSTRLVGAGRPPTARDNQDVILIVAPRQSNQPSRKYRLRYRRAASNHTPAATAEMAILIVAVFPIQIVALQSESNTGEN